jgi:magnesium transporter
MITYFKLLDGRVVESTPEAGGSVVLCVNPSASERAWLTQECHLDEHNLNSALDPAELPRVELDTNHLAVIFKHPKHYSAKDNLVFHINSIGLFLFSDRLIVISPEDGAATFAGRAFSKVQNLQMLFLRVISSCITHFFGHLQVINDIAAQLETKLSRSMENRHLLQMFSIEKSLVYYVNAISANGRVIDRLKANARSANTDGLSPDMVEYADDLGIENAQCLEQAQVYANVFTGLMDARASIVNNNLNVLMKRLTIINVVFMPLNMLSSIGGMSEYSAWTAKMPWPLSYGLYMLAMTVIGLITYRILAHVERRHVTR